MNTIIKYITPTTNFVRKKDRQFFPLAVEIIWIEKAYIINKLKRLKDSIESDYDTLYVDQFYQIGIAPMNFAD